VSGSERQTFEVGLEIGDRVGVQEEGLEDFRALRLEARFAVVRAGRGAAPIGSVLVARAAEVEDALVEDLRVTASHQHRVEVDQQACNDKSRDC
jgi:hypothetical protein